LNALFFNVSTKLKLKGPLKYQEETYILSMCKRGPTQPYLGYEMRTTKETKESFYNLKTT
jgi:hypothetical protein